MDQDAYRIGWVKKVSSAARQQENSAASARVQQLTCGSWLQLMLELTCNNQRHQICSPSSSCSTCSASRSARSSRKHSPRRLVINTACLSCSISGAILPLEDGLHLCKSLRPFETPQSRAHEMTSHFGACTGKRLKGSGRWGVWSCEHSTSRLAVLPTSPAHQSCLDRMDQYFYC